MFFNAPARSQDERCTSLVHLVISLGIGGPERALVNQLRRADRRW